MLRKLYLAASAAIESLLAGLLQKQEPVPAYARPCVEPLESRQLFSVSYDLMELTLGGSYSSAYDVNASGQVVGDASTAGDNEWHAFFFDGESTIDLGTLGGTFSSARMVNDAGQVIGTSSLTGDESAHAFFWGGNGQMVDLSLGGSYSDAIAINQAGQVIGHSGTTGDAANLAYLYTDGSILELGLGGSFSTAIELTESGMVLGTGATADGFNRAFLFDGHRIIEIASSGDSTATDVNERGQVVGSFVTSDGKTHAFVYSDGVLTDLGTLGGSSSMALRINEAGDVLGESIASDGKTHAFLYRDGVMIDLGVLGKSGSRAIALNEAGQVLFESKDAAGVMHAMLRTGDTTVDLGGFGADTYADGLTESGIVFGHGYNASYLMRAFVYSGGVMTDLTPSGNSQSYLYDVNEAGEALVQADSYYLYRDGTIDLLKDLSESGSLWKSFDYADTLGAGGHVMGYGTIEDAVTGTTRYSAFVLGPASAAPNVEPTAADDSATTAADTAVVIDVLANDTDADGGLLTLVELGTASQGVVTITDDGKVMYTPNSGFSGQDSFTYTVSDGQGGLATATVTVTVEPAPLPAPLPTPPPPPPPPPPTVTDLAAKVDELLSSGTISKKAADQLSQPIRNATQQLEKKNASPENAAKQLQKAADKADLLPAAERDAFLKAVNEILAGLA